MRIKSLLLLTALLFIAAACNPANSPDANDLMPDIAGYKVTEGEDLTEALTRMGQGASILAGQPEIAFAVEGVDRIMQCYQDAGAVSGRIFTNEADVLSAGVIVIVDRNRLTNPQTFINCVHPSDEGPDMVSAIEPCSNTYTLKRDGNEYYFLYAATRPEVCQTFCSNLEGCTQ